MFRNCVTISDVSIYAFLLSFRDIFKVNPSFQNLKRTWLAFSSVPSSIVKFIINREIRINNHKFQNRKSNCYLNF